MKRITIVAFFLLIISYININADNFGIKAGISFSKFTSWSLAKYKISPSIGAFYDIKIKKDLYLQPELIFENTGTSLKKSYSFLNKGYVDIYSFIIPINISYRPYIGKETLLLIDGGLYTSIGIFGDKKYEFYDLPTVVDRSLDIAKRFNYGLNLGVGIKNKKISYQLSFVRGISSILKDENAYHQSFRFTIGYSF